MARPDIQSLSWGMPLAVISAVAFGVVLPFFWLGIPSGHDFEFHFNSWIEVLDHWKHGVAYPQWAAWAHNGYGEARFIFYPPVSWTLGAALGLLLPWKLVSGVYIWIALTLAGSSMYTLARRWMPRSEAVFAAAVYSANPYHLVIVYWRSAMAELLVAIYLPLLLLLISRSEEEGTRVVAPLSIVMALGWITNIPGALMMNYSLAALVLYLAVSRRSLAPLAYAALAAALGAGMAGFYVVPVVHQGSWVHIGQVFAPELRPQDNFLFAQTSHADHDRFNLLVSIIAMSQLAITLGALFLLRRIRDRPVWRMLLCWTGVSAALMFGAASALWTYLPELRFVQLPWRWLLCVNVPFALAMVMALRSWWFRGVVCAVSLGIVLLCWHRVQVPWWDNASDIQEMLDNQHDGLGYEGTDEYVPTTADTSEVDDKAPQAQFQGKGKAEIHISSWQPESRTLIAKASTRGKLLLRLFNYRLWHVEVNGRPVSTESEDSTGQMVIPIVSGESRIHVWFVGGWDRTLGIIISVLALFAVGTGFAMGRRRSAMTPA